MFADNDYTSTLYVRFVLFFHVYIEFATSGNSHPNSTKSISLVLVSVADWSFYNPPVLVLWVLGITCVSFFSPPSDSYCDWLAADD